jgi:hypothetical protein
LSFPSLGDFANGGATTYFVRTVVMAGNDTPVLQDNTGKTIFVGQYTGNFQLGVRESHIAVFDFDSFVVNNGVRIVDETTPAQGFSVLSPVAFLSRGGVNIAGNIIGATHPIRRGSLHGQECIARGDWPCRLLWSPRQQARSVSFRPARGGTPTFAAGSVTATLGTLASGTNATVTIIVQPIAAGHGARISKPLKNLYTIISRSNPSRALRLIHCLALPKNTIDGDNRQRESG